MKYLLLFLLLSVSLYGIDKTNKVYIEIYTEVITYITNEIAITNKSEINITNIINLTNIVTVNITNTIDITNTITISNIYNIKKYFSISVGYNIPHGLIFGGTYNLFPNFSIGTLITLPIGAIDPKLSLGIYANYYIW